MQADTAMPCAPWLFYMQVYYEERGTGALVNVKQESTLAQVLSCPGYSVLDGTPSFIILASGTEFREQYLTRVRT